MIWVFSSSDHSSGGVAIKARQSTPSFCVGRSSSSANGFLTGLPGQLNGRHSIGPEALNNLLLEAAELQIVQRVVVVVLSVGFAPSVVVVGEQHSEREVVVLILLLLRAQVLAYVRRLSAAKTLTSPWPWGRKCQAPKRDVDDATYSGLN